jgi:hypothetical protein
VLIVSWEDNIGKSLRMDRAKTTMIRSATSGGLTHLGSCHDCSSVLIVSWEDNIGKSLRMDRAKTTMIRSATQQQMFLRPFHVQVAAEVSNQELSKLIHHHVWFFARFSQNEKKLVSYYFFPTGWLDSKKQLLVQNISSNDD